MNGLHTTYGCTHNHPRRSDATKCERQLKMRAESHMNDGCYIFPVNDLGLMEARIPTGVGYYSISFWVLTPDEIYGTVTPSLTKGTP